MATETANGSPPFSEVRKFGTFLGVRIPDPGKEAAYADRLYDLASGV